jgi:hypothetical protein
MSDKITHILLPVSTTKIKFCKRGQIYAEIKSILFFLLFPRRRIQGLLGLLQPWHPAEDDRWRPSAFLCWKSDDESSSSSQMLSSGIWMGTCTGILFALTGNAYFHANYGSQFTNLDHIRWTLGFRSASRIRPVPPRSRGAWDGHGLGSSP